jgi:hypothetical protein
VLVGLALAPLLSLLDPWRCEVCRARERDQVEDLEE